MNCLNFNNRYQPVIFCFYIAIQLLFPLHSFAQANDSKNFFDGSYNKTHIKKEKIKVVTVETFINKTLSSKHIFNFDKKGLLLNQLIRDTNDLLINEYVFVYNDHGDQVERRNVNYTLNQTSAVTFERTYNNNRLATEKSSQFPFVTTHTYNSKGKRIQSVINTSMGDEPSKKIISFTYDDKGILKNITESSISPGESLTETGRTEFLYDQSGNLVEIKRKDAALYNLNYDKDDLLKSTVTIMPDDLGSIMILDKYSYEFW